ncbi:MAG: radical SAM protein [Planctomycetota bacterium]
MKSLPRPSSTACRVVVANPPWPGPGYGARSDVRWPHRRPDKYLEYPIYLAYQVALLRQAGADVVFIDAVVDELDIERFARRATEGGPRLVVLECSTPSIRYDLESARRVKELSPTTAVVLVGSHATVFSRELMQANEAIDAVARGEFDEVVVSAYRALTGEGSLAAISGLTYRLGNQVVVNPDAPGVQDLDAMPFPDRERVRTERYGQANFTGRISTTVISSRGCPYKCTFCLWPQTLTGRKVRYRSAGSVLDEIEEAVKRYGVSEVYFDDDTFSLNQRRVLAICDELVRRRLNVRWIAQCRADDLDREVLRAMKAAGCHTLRIGVESGSQELLDRMKKAISLERVKKCFDEVDAAGIKGMAFFLFGIPGETEQTIRQTIDFAKSLRAHHAQFAVAIPNPGTELFDECKAKGWLRVNDWEDYAAQRCLVETDLLSAGAVDEARIRAYREFYFRPAYMWRVLRTVRSVDDLRFVWRSARSIVDRIGYFRKTAAT